MRESGSPDHALARAAAEGSEQAWHDFVERYSGLIYSMICRYLVRPDEDERRTVYVQVLDSLYGGALARYDGRTALSTWIGVVTRSRCMDYLRSQHGRRQVPAWLEALSEADREIYRRYYVEGQGFAEICGSASGNDHGISVDSLVEALERIDAHMDRSVRRRMAFELQARSVSAVSGRLLEYLTFARQEMEQAQASTRADLALVESEARALVEKLRNALEELESEEREVIRLRYEEGMNAESVASQMRIGSARRVYTISDRAIRKLRLLLGEEGAGA